MTNLNELNLRNIESNEIRLRIVPSERILSYSCVQDLMRDYADLADWTSHYYGENGREARGHECYIYARKLLDALEESIRRVLDDKRDV